MISLDFEWQTNEFMLYCRTTQLREKSMMAYEQSLKLFERWCRDEMGIFTVDKVTENVIRRYISELQERGKYTFYRIDKQKKTNYPERRRDYRKPISTATINNYIRNIRVFFNWLERNYIIKKTLSHFNSFSPASWQVRICSGRHHYFSVGRGFVCLSLSIFTPRLYKKCYPILWIALVVERRFLNYFLWLKERKL